MEAERSSSPSSWSIGKHLVIEPYLATVVLVAAHRGLGLDGRAAGDAAGADGKDSAICIRP